MGASLFKRGEIFWYHIRHKGKRYQGSTNIKVKKQNGQGASGKKAAEEFLSALHTEIIKGKVGIGKPKDVPNFGEAMASFLSWSKIEHRAKPATHKRYVTSSVALLKHFKNKSLSEINVAEVEKFKTKRSDEDATRRGGANGRTSTGRKVKPATVNRELACLRIVFNHAIKNEAPVTNPVRQTGAKTIPEQNEQTRVLSYEEQKRYMAVATPTLRDVATLMLETGMRPEEVYRIERSNVHLAESYVFNPFGKTKAAKRRISLTAPAREVLARRMEMLGGRCLFPHAADADKPTPKVNNAHDRALKASKVAHFTMYSMRHTWATRAAQAGVDLVSLAAMLGHSKINMVMRYAHPTEEHQRQAMSKIEAYVAAQRIADAEQAMAHAPTLIQ